METKKALTQFRQSPAPPQDLQNQLSKAGLELWHSPEGFWAVRLKPVTSQLQPTRRPPRGLRASRNERSEA